MSTRMRIAVVVVVIGGTVCAGYWMQRQVPSEKYRVRHPQAYSVCKPAEWSAEMDYAPNGVTFGNAKRLDGITLSPDQFDGRRPKLSVSRLASAPDEEVLRADGWIDGMFQGQPAMTLEQKAKRALIRAATFERSGQWFEVVEALSVPAAGEEEQWWAFLKTFKYPDGEPAPMKVDRAVVTSAPSTTQAFQFPVMGQ